MNLVINPESQSVFYSVFSRTLFAEFMNSLEQLSTQGASSASDSLSYEALKNTLQDVDFDNFPTVFQEYEDLADEYVEYLNSTGFSVTYSTEDGDTVSKQFTDFLERLKTSPSPEDMVMWLLSQLYLTTVGVSRTWEHAIPESVIENAPAVKFILDNLQDQQTTKDLMDEYNDIGPLPSEGVLKSISPVDITLVPEYLLDSLYQHKGLYYKPSEVRKMLTASGQVAQSLEKQDLEPQLENSAEEVVLTAEEIGRNYIKKLKLKREKRTDNA